MKALLQALHAHTHRFRYAFLVLPLMLTAGLTLLGVVLCIIDRAAGPRGIALGLPADPAMIRTLLSAIIGATASVAAVTFSIAILVLQLVSQQFSPRAIRGFVGDRVSQVIAGIFSGTILYCVVVLRTIAGGDAPFVPSLAASVGALLAIVSIILLLVFVSHISKRVQVSRIARDIAQGALAELRVVYPEPFGVRDAVADPDAEVTRWRAQRAPQRVHASSTGFVQSISIDRLPELIAGDGDGACIHLCVAPGDFIAVGDPIAEIWASEKSCAELERHIHRTTQLSDSRDSLQDLLYAIRQLADIAIKGMSPSLNDPTTAWTCVAYIGTVTEQLVVRGLPPRVLRYPRETTTIVVRRPELAEYLEVGFLQIGRYASRDPVVAGRMLHELARIAAATTSRDDLALLEDVGRTLAQATCDHAETEHDRSDVTRALDRVLARTAAVH